MNPQKTPAPALLLTQIVVDIEYLRTAVFPDTGIVVGRATE